jgi:hypothetical protein
MEKKQILTGLFLIPTLKSNPNLDAKLAINAIVYQLGALNCESDENYAIIRFNGTLREETKSVLDNVVKPQGYIIAYIEAEEDSEFIDDVTFHIPTDDEMRKHLQMIG